MIKISLQDQIDKLPPGNQVKLRPGEYKGPIVLNKPITVEGSSTTIWGKEFPVIKINNGSVVLKNLQVEATGTQSPHNQGVAIETNPMYNIAVENVEVKGLVVGFGEESGAWDYPVSLNLGQLPPGQRIIYKMNLQVPVPCNIVSGIAGIDCTPEKIGPGLSEVTIKINSLLQNSLICGYFFLTSKFMRRILVTGTVKSAINDEVTKDIIIWSPAGSHARSTAPAPPAPTTPHTIQPVNEPENILHLIKGQRINLVEEHPPCKLVLGIGWKSKVPSNLELDVVAFLIGPNNKVRHDHDFVYYGNRRSLDGSLELLGPKPEEGYNEKLSIDTARISSDHQKIVIALVLYQGKERRQNFSQMAQVFVKVRDETTCKDLCFYEMSNHTALETILIAVELYRHKGKWKLAAIGSGYRGDLASLCRKYGLEVE